MTIRSIRESSVNLGVGECTNGPIHDSLRACLAASGLFAPGMLEYNLSVRKLLSKPKTALYAAAGADLSGFHSTIHAEQALFICDYRNSVLLQKALSYLKQEFDRVHHDPISDKYSTIKRLQGYAPYYALRSDQDLGVAIMTEFKACGAHLLDLRYTGEIPVLTYSLPDGNSHSTHRVFFLNKRLEDMTLADITCTLGDRIDVYHHRAAMELPSHYDTLAERVYPMIFDLMPHGGAFVTDDVGVHHFDNTLVDFLFSFPEIVEEEHALVLSGPQPDEALIPARLIGSIEGRYGRCLRIRRKERSDTLSQLQLPPC